MNRKWKSWVWRVDECPYPTINWNGERIFADIEWAAEIQVVVGWCKRFLKLIEHWLSLAFAVGFVGLRTLYEYFNAN